MFAFGRMHKSGFGYMHDDCHDVLFCVACGVRCCHVCASHACKAVQTVKLLSVTQQDCSSAIKR